MFWENEIEKWATRRKKISNSSISSFIQFFELVFKNTRCSQYSWFGVHKHGISLVIGQIFLAAITNGGIWILLDTSFTSTEEIEFMPVKSTQTFSSPLIWGHVKSIKDIGFLLKNSEIWQSYSEASEKILNAPISKARDAEFQKSKGKRCLSDFWGVPVIAKFYLPELQREQQRIEDEGYFNAENLEDARRRVTSSIVQRQGQAKFRRKLLNAYSGRCPVTDCDVEAAIEAAHIIPYLGTETDHITNGLPLRADIHTLFDLHLLSIRPDAYEIVINPNLVLSSYQGLVGRKLALPEDKLTVPNKVALTKHYELFLQKCKSVK
jgi:hypothetical protein